MYHAAHGCQAASLSLTAARLRGLFWACQVESQKNAGFLAHVERDQHDLEALSGFACMLLLCLLKGGGLIAAMMDHMAKMILTHTLASARTATVWLLPSARLR